MRRRLTLATVGVVALALVLSGLFTLVLVRRAAREETRRDLVVQAEDIAGQVEQVDKLLALNRVTRFLKLEGIARVSYNRVGALVGTLPAGIGADDLDSGALRQGRTVSGVKGSVVFAAAPLQPDPAARDARRLVGSSVVVLTREADAGLRRSGLWFALSAVVSLLVAAVVADRLGRRVTAPLEEAEGATRRIAAGDLDARLTVGARSDPETASLAHSINSMADSLLRAKGLERQFLLAVSHDLRTPLTSIRGFAEAIAEGAAPDHERAAGVIAAESRRLERLVGDLLELANLDARRFSLQVRPVDVAEIVADTAEGFRFAADEAGIGLVIDVAPVGTVTVPADPDRLAQVIANLVENALKFAASRIEVTAALLPGAVVVMVDDDGPGMPAEELGRVFDRPYQPGRAPARRVGSGLGLAIVAELVRAMGGAVRAEAPSVGGTRVLVELPTKAAAG